MSQEGKVVKIGIIKPGAIGTSVVLEYLLDERADRKDIDVRVYGTGAKMVVDEELLKAAIQANHDLYIVAAPANVKVIKKIAKKLKEAGKRVIIISDEPVKKSTKEFEEAGYGYIIVYGDPMIGARREFLDPTEMALFNAYVLAVLSATGALRIVTKAIDSVIEALKEDKEPVLPKIKLSKKRLEKEAGFSNPYALAKAIAAYEMARKVAELTSEACFKEQEPQRYIVLAAAAHEMIRYAAKLAEEARELEKPTDTLLRTPHHSSGRLLSKTKLLEKPR